MKQTDLTPLIEVMAKLRDPESGCPWDKAQTHVSLVAMTFEETTELADAIAKNDSENICEELGDILFHLVFYARIAEESDDFTMQEVIDGIVEKMTRRHPHIFAGKVYANEAEQKADWQRIKAEEKSRKGEIYPHLSHLSSGQKIDALPAISQSIAMQEQLATMGFDWPSANDVFDKIVEEIDEVKVEINAKNKVATFEEFGDLLFAVMNLGRKLDLDPDMALRKASHKFYSRSESMIVRAGSLEAFSSLSLEEQDVLWDAVKLDEKNQKE